MKITKKFVVEEIWELGHRFTRGRRTLQQAIDMVRRDAQKNVPTGYKYEVRSVVRWPATDHTICWYANNAMQSLPLEPVCERFEPAGSYVFHGRFEA